MSEKRDYYEVLGIERDVDAAGLKRAYRKLAMELHPDRNPGDKEAENRFKEASEAYQVLCDPEKRAYYDRFGHAGPSGMPGAGFRDASDIFSAFSDVFDMFGMGGGRRSGPPRGSDIETRLSITLKEAASGVSKEIRVLRNVVCPSCAGSGAAPGTQPEKCQHCGGRGQVMHAQGFMMISSTCPVCRGEGKVVRKPCPDCDGAGVHEEQEGLQISVPPGVDDGARLRLAGRGEAAPRGGQPGNLYVVLHVEGDDRFERHGADLHTEVLVTFPQLALGDRVFVPTLEGEATVEIPPGTQAGDALPVHGLGMPHVGARGRGDLVAHLRLVVPEALTAEQESHLRAFANAGGRTVNTERGRLFKRKKKR